MDLFDTIREFVTIPYRALRKIGHAFAEPNYGEKVREYSFPTGATNEKSDPHYSLSYHGQKCLNLSGDLDHLIHPDCRRNDGSVNYANHPPTDENKQQFWSSLDSIANAYIAGDFTIEEPTPINDRLFFLPLNNVELEKILLRIDALDNVVGKVEWAGCQPGKEKALSYVRHLLLREVGTNCSDQFRITIEEYFDQQKTSIVVQTHSFYLSPNHVQPWSMKVVIEGTRK